MWTLVGIIDENGNVENEDSEVVGKDRDNDPIYTM